MDLNHRQWLETVPQALVPFVDKAVADWNAKADEFNSWTALGWDERDELLRKAADRLFVPLSGQPYHWFESGAKRWELRALARQFTTKHVRVGRLVELRRGYSTPDSLWGTVAEVIVATSVEGFFDLVPWQQVICAPGIEGRREAEKIAREILRVSTTDPVIGFRVEMNEVAASTSE